MMLQEFWRPPLRPFVIRRLVEVIVFIGVLTAASIGQHYFMQAKVQYLATQEVITQQPEHAAYLVQVRKTIAERLPDIARINQLIVNRSEIHSFLEFIETTALTTKVTVEVNSIHEEKVAAPTTNEEPLFPEVQIGFEVVRLTVISRGAPKQLFEFLHRLEHSQYLAIVPNWRVTATATGDQSGAKSRTPAGIGAPPGAGTSSSREESGQMQADVILIVRTDDQAN